MRPFDEIKTASKAVIEAGTASSRPRGISYLCLWKLNRLGLLPLEESSGFDTLVEMYLIHRKE